MKDYRNRLKVKLHKKIETTDTELTGDGFKADVHNFTKRLKHKSKATIKGQLEYKGFFPINSTEDIFLNPSVLTLIIYLLAIYCVKIQPSFKMSFDMFFFKSFLNYGLQQNKQ